MRYRSIDWKPSGEIDTAPSALAHAEEAAKREARITELATALNTATLALVALMKRVENYAEWASRDRLRSQPSRVGTSILEDVRELGALVDATAALEAVLPVLGQLDADEYGPVCMPSPIVSAIETALEVE